MIFFEDTDGTKHPISEVRKISDRGVEMSDGVIVQVWDKDLNYALKASRPIIPAAAGTTLLHLFAPSYEGPEKWELSRQTVIGWRTDEYGGMEPLVAASDDGELPAEYAVEHPNGKVSVVGWGADIESAEDFFGFMRASEEKRRINKAAASADNDAS